MLAIHYCTKNEAPDICQESFRGYLPDTIQSAVAKIDSMFETTQVSKLIQINERYLIDFSLTLICPLFHLIHIRINHLFFAFPLNDQEIYPTATHCS